MSLKEFKLAYGHGTQSVMLPEEHISDVLEGVPTPRLRRERSHHRMHASSDRR